MKKMQQKVCRHCGAEAKTKGKKCPYCRKPYKGGLFKKLFVLLCLGVAVLFCVFFLGKALINSNGVQGLFAQGSSYIKEDVGRKLGKHVISDKQATRIKVGSSKRRVLRQLGPPAARQKRGAGSCLRYRTDDRTRTDFWKLCFDRDNKLISKRRS